MFRPMQALHNPGDSDYIISGSQLEALCDMLHLNFGVGGSNLSCSTTDKRGRENSKGN